MQINITGNYNTATGTQALNGNADGNENTATGFNALFYNHGDYNTAEGSGALYNNQFGDSNTAFGHHALFADYSGSNNIALGDSAGSNINGSNNIDLGNVGVASETGVMRLGTEEIQTATYIAGIRMSGLAVATGVGITDDGRLGVRASSRRYKERIRPMANASEAIFSLQPVTFRYKKDLDPKRVPQFGLVAEDVAKINPDLVLREPDGKPLTVRYDEVNAMLLNEFLKEHKRVEAQGKELAVQATELAELKSALGRQAEALQKVSARLESTAAAARLVENR